MTLLVSSKMRALAKLDAIIVKTDKKKTLARATRYFHHPIGFRQRNKSIILIYSTFVILNAALAVSICAASSFTNNKHQPPNRSNHSETNERELKQLNHQDENGFQLHDLYSMSVDQQLDQHRTPAVGQSLPRPTTTTVESSSQNPNGPNLTSTAVTSNRNATSFECPNGLLTFELSTGFIYKPTSSDDTLSMIPSTLQLTDCLNYCLHNSTCLAINFEVGLCVLLATSAEQNQQNFYSSQFPVFTIYAEKKCLLTEPSQAKHRRRCQRAWTFERVAGYEMKIKPRRRLKLETKELCMDACLVEREFSCRSANWYRLTGDCTLSDQDRHSVSQSEAGEQQIKASLSNFYGPQNMSEAASSHQQQQRPALANHYSFQGFQQHYSNLGLPPAGLVDRSRLSGQLDPTLKLGATGTSGGGENNGHRVTPFKQLFHRTRLPTTASELRSGRQAAATASSSSPLQSDQPSERQADWSMQQHYIDLPANTMVDYLENNCIYEPNKLCEFRKIQNRVLKTVDSIYQDVATLDECRQKCLNAPYRCYSFDYGDTSERVCRTSHLDQASLLSVNEPYLEVVGAITYELAACFNVSIQCRAKGMVALVSSSKSFNGKIYAKSRPTSCVNDVTNSLQFELSMKYHDEQCDVRASSDQQQGVFSNDIVIQHHDRIVTTQDVGLSVYCQYDLGNRSVTNNVDLAIEKLPDGPMESKQQTGTGGQTPSSDPGVNGGPLTIMGLATTVVRSPNVTMRITNMNGQPVTSATVGDRLALLFEIKEKTSPFGIQVREIVAMDGRQLASGQQQNNITNWPNNNAAAAANGQQQNSSISNLPQVYRQRHYAGDDIANGIINESLVASAANSIQFLDHDGCPTDANLMGPLVRMDPQGHRLLAPFDAFKFPASDMVFFRAVVSSCVAECKPAVCPSVPGSSGSSSFNRPELASSSHDELFSPTPPDDVVATTRNMPTTTGQQQQQQRQPESPLATQQPIAYSSPSASQFTATSTTIAPSTTTSIVTTYASSNTMTASHQQQPTKSPSTLAPYEPNRTTKLHNQQQHVEFSSGDLLTTVPGFNVHQQANQQQQQQQVEGGQERASTATISGFDLIQAQSATTSGLLADLASSATVNGVSSTLIGSDHSMTINMTNNHNLGRPSPRPMTTTTTSADSNEQSDSDLHARDPQQQQSSTSGQPGRRPPPPAKLDPLTAQERQAILDLLSGHEKSSLLSSSAPSSQQSSASLVDEQIITSGLMKLYPILESFRHGNSRSRELSTSANLSANLTSRSVLQEIKELISDQFYRPERHNRESSSQMNGDNLSPTATTTTVAGQQNKIKRSSAEFVSIPAPSQEFVELINRTLIDYIIAEELKSTLLTQMLIDEARATSAPHDLGAELEPSQGSIRKEARNLANSPEDNELQSREFPVELLAKFFSTLNWPQRTAIEEAGSGNRLTFEQVSRLVKARFDQELAGKIQRILKLLDDSKRLDSGAQQQHDHDRHQQQQQQQRRKKREADEDELRKSSSYSYMSQPQLVELQNNSELMFTNSYVEMYHTDELHRIKRQAPSFEGFEAHSQSHHQLAQPKYEIEEMIVQSIKIVDRLQFEDEIQRQQQEQLQQQHQQELSNNGPTRNSKSTALRKRRPAMKRVLLETDEPQANKQLGEKDSTTADDSSDRLQEDRRQPQIKSRLSAINILLVAMCFIFIQISMVLLCLINWNNQRQRQTRGSLFTDLSPFKTVDSSTIPSSMTYSDCSNYR